MLARRLLELERDTVRRCNVNWIGKALNMILLLLYSKMLIKVNTYEDVNPKFIATKTSSAFPAYA